MRNLRISLLKISLGFTLCVLLSTVIFKCKQWEDRLRDREKRISKELDVLEEEELFERELAVSREIRMMNDRWSERRREP